jgi:hypothetical protein
VSNLQAPQQTNKKSSSKFNKYNNIYVVLSFQSPWTLSHDILTITIQSRETQATIAILPMRKTKALEGSPEVL